MSRAPIAVLAIGGDALFRPGDAGTHRDQVRGARRAARAVATLVREGYRVVAVHGSRPQLGRELVRNEESSTKLPPQPLDVCVAATQGALGYLVATESRNELRRLRIDRPVTSLLTWTLVGLDDPAFQHPTLPVGPTLPTWRAKALMRPGEAHYTEHAGQGWRRVVSSPEPIEILNLDAVEALLDRGHVVLASGGGGIPVAVDARGQLIGVEAVVDTDRAASLLAQHLGAELLCFLTGVDQLYASFGRTDQRAIERVSSTELRALNDAGHFPADGVGIKVEAALEFVEDGGLRAVVTSPSRLAAALADRAGTRVMRVVEDGHVRRQLNLFPLPGNGELAEEEL
ncbi:MAG: carbamate kinase [Myxococcales bacterium]|nr:carbamate kinase [Myxococcales bacterium]